LNGIRNNLPWSDVTLINGSGISSENKSSPMLLARWLAVVEKSHTTTRSLKTLLPLVGHSGWISARFKYPDVTHRMWAKTGSLDYVTNLAGYMVGKDQKMYAFALLFSDQQNRTYLDTYNDKHADYLRQKAPSERRKLSSKIDEILVHWLNKY
jgi:D-alanyl-D-alanine carboxypeptidase/D-alanyl-D-alanine-endopeptidase (penicillin-binding protein 4)